jgi:hypothetical protein
MTLLPLSNYQIAKLKTIIPDHALHRAVVLVDHWAVGLVDNWAVWRAV